MPLSANQPGVLLPTLPNATPLPETVLFAFDDCAFPFRQNVACQLIASQQPRLALRHGEEGYWDEVLLYAGSVLQIGEQLHLWYIGNYGPLANEFTLERTNCCLCYAVSRDGLTWEKPSLGLVDFNGSRNNNIVDLPVPTLWTSAAVHFDAAEVEPSRRFKLVYQARIDGSLYFCTAFSADGFRWIPSARNPVALNFRAAGLTRHRDLYYACGETAGVIGGARRLETLASADFEHWSPCGAPGLERPEADGEAVHYGAGLWHRGNVILGVYGQWHGHPSGDRRLAAIDLGLAISHDAMHYHEPAPGFKLIPAREQPGSPADVIPALRQGQGMANVGEHTLCWYGLWRGTRGSGVRVAGWQRDRLGMLQPVEPWDARAVTCPFEIVHGRARAGLNVSGLGDDTYLRVDLLDEGFRPLPGFSGTDAAIVCADGLRQPLLWGDGDLLLPTHGLLRLAFHFGGARPEDARLYACYLGE